MAQRDVKRAAGAAVARVFDFADAARRVRAGAHRGFLRRLVVVFVRHARVRSAMHASRSASFEKLSRLRSSIIFWNTATCWSMASGPQTLARFNRVHASSNSLLEKSSTLSSVMILRTGAISCSRVCVRVGRFLLAAFFRSFD